MAGYGSQEERHADSVVSTSYTKASLQTEPRLNSAIVMRRAATIGIGKSKSIEPCNTMCIIHQEGSQPLKGYLQPLAENEASV